jgi:predicted acetyltransferase
MEYQLDLSLVEPTVDLAEELRALVEDYARAGESHYLRALASAGPDELAEVLAQLRRQSEGQDLRPGQVPQTTYLLRRSDGALVGTSRLRHRLTPGLEVEGGHIGYDIRPSQRRRGYGTRILALTLEKARERGLRRVLVTCDDDNVGSARVIERNGGRLQDRVTSRHSGKLVRRYWIDLSPESL